VEAYDDNASAELKIEERTGRKEDTDDEFTEDNPQSDKQQVPHVGHPNNASLFRWKLTTLVRRGAS
jgi:hypothetical protein